jgi:hypothetical protein
VSKDVGSGCKNTESGKNSNSGVACAEAKKAEIAKANVKNKCFIKIKADLQKINVVDFQLDTNANVICCRIKYFLRCKIR